MAVVDKLVWRFLGGYLRYYPIYRFTYVVGDH